MVDSRIKFLRGVMIACDVHVGVDRHGVAMNATRCGQNVPVVPSGLGWLGRRLLCDANSGCCQIHQQPNGAERFVRHEPVLREKRRRPRRILSDKGLITSHLRNTAHRRWLDSIRSKVAVNIDDYVQRVRDGEAEQRTCVPGS
jgi:hypothetical protein